jgi:hypothetical protein
MGLGTISGYLLNTVNGLSISSIAKINKKDSYVVTGFCPHAIPSTNGFL